MMDTKALRQKILDLAIHGKLVPQDPNDEPASVLLERIKAEKERLIKEGKIKRSKKSAKSSDTPHYPYLLPNGWEWCNLEDIVCELKYGTSEKSLSVGKIAVLRMGNITNVGTIDYSNLVYSSNNEDIKLYSLEKDDLLFNRTNSSEWVGKTAIYKKEQPAIYAGYLIRIRPILIFSDYLNTVMNSSYYRNWCYNVKTDAVNQSNINAQKLSQLMIPIPPLKEQERIVVEVAKWISLINTIKNSKEDLQTTIKQAKSKILNLAIHGKLVPQDPNDEPAIELLKRINPDFTPCDNGHYTQLPEGWAICKMKQITSITNGKSQKNVETLNGIYPIYGSGGVIGRANQYLCIAGSTIIGRKGTINNPIFVEEHFWNVDTAFGLKANDAILDKYLYYFCLSFDFSKLDKSTAMPSLTKTSIGNVLIPIPPYKEQERIVAKIDMVLDTMNEILRAV
ncbi:type I restriction modification DNA specificity domain protein [Bacteroides sp. 4_3_47FAA]|nr:type I restriction modification DNA specificity domain protein [Bacteroides sp. 4_3_47FAA]